jgi:radical SAM enzyme (TIGR01210 family)
MNEDRLPEITDNWIIKGRGSKNPVDPFKPYGWLVEKERTATGKTEDTAIIFLTNSECPFHCLMCDLWKNTTDKPVPPGAIPQQIEYALTRMGPAKHLKLYNSGSFFDEKAIPSDDYRAIASLISDFETVIVESHPRLIGEKCLALRDLLKPELQVALGLETIHPEVLQKLNKKMTTDDFISAVDFLSKNGILSRAFILLRPPFLSEEEGLFWAKKTLDFAFDAGSECCTIIPVRGGNGAMEQLKEKGLFTPPDIMSLEKVLDYGLSLNKGRVFADTWDLGLFSSCEKCLDERTARISEMNLSQIISAPVICTCCTGNS